LLWFLTSLATLPLGVNSGHSTSWSDSAFSACTTSVQEEQNLQSPRSAAAPTPPTSVDILFACYVVLGNLVAPLTLMSLIYARIYRTVRLHKMSVILRDVLITEVVVATPSPTPHPHPTPSGDIIQLHGESNPND